jgi:hypothetical protein
VNEAKKKRKKTILSSPCGGQHGDRVDACVAAPAWLDIENNITLDLVLLAWGPLAADRETPKNLAVKSIHLRGGHVVLAADDRYWGCLVSTKIFFTQLHRMFDTYMEY